MDNSHPKSFAGRPKNKSGLLGQVLTPENIAEKMVNRLFANRPDEGILIVDPCTGPFIFPEKIIKNGVLTDKDQLVLVDIDPDMISVSTDRSKNFQNICLFTDDYLDLQFQKKFDYAILNPPYIRQEWLDSKKEEYKNKFWKRYGLKIPGTSNLYVYFIVKILQDLRPGGEFACIVYDTWKFTKYGQWLTKYINSVCEAVEFEVIHNQPFEDHLIDAVIIYGKKNISEKHGTEHINNTHVAPSYFDGINGFSPIIQIFETKRGLRLKQANFFLCGINECELFGATPFVKKVIKSKSMYAISNDHPEAAILIAEGQNNLPAYRELLQRLEKAKERESDNVSILTWFRERPQTWYLHSVPPKAPLLFNYYIRNRPRHIYNPMRAYSDNFYGLVPKQENSDIFAWLAVLNSTVVCSEILTYSRNQGGGLAKLQLFEYRRIQIPDISNCSKDEIHTFSELGGKLINRPGEATSTILEIDAVIASIFMDNRLKTDVVSSIFAEINNLKIRTRSK